MGKGKLSGAKAVVTSLERQQVDVVFGYPGGATLPIYDSLCSSKIRHIMPRHEQAGAHMADGFARSTGKTGVCMATSGPGATNLVTGIATAYMDSSPIVAITGQVPTTMIGNDAFQEVDITGITIPITKHNYLVKEAHKLPLVFDEAFYLASTGRKGPVLIDIPKDIQNETFAEEQVKRGSLEGYKPTEKGHAGQIKRAAEMIKKAERPVIIAGGGVFHADAHEELLAFVEKTGVPVTWTLMGKSVFPGSHGLNLGMVGYHGRVAANTAVQEADVILAMGTRFGDRSTGPLATYAPKAQIIHIDIDPAEISKNISARLPIVGDIKLVLPELTERLAPEQCGEWCAYLQKVAEEHPLRGLFEGVTVPNILRKAADVVPDPIIVTDVGRHQIFAAHYISTERPRSFITSGGLGTMGFGFPAALGVRAGNRDRPVLCVSGDGSFLMNCQELVTSVEEDLPVIVLIMNDYCLGMIRQLQSSFYGKRYQSCHIGKSADFAALAEGLGAEGIRVTKESEIVPAIEQAMKSGTTTVIDCIIEKPANVYPMVTGASLLDYVEEEE